VENLSNSIPSTQDIDETTITLDRQSDSFRDRRDKLTFFNKKLQQKSNKISRKSLDLIYLDDLTGLPNRNYLLSHIERAIAIEKEQKGYLFALLIVDINRFKAINISLGRNLGDKLLLTFACKLKSCLREKDLVARLGSDEFAILLEDLDRLNYVIDIAERIYQELFTPFQIDGYDFFIDASIGIVVDTEKYHQPEHLLRDAELAVAHAKKTPQSFYQIFNSEIYNREIGILQLKNDLRLALAHHEFEVYYQPIVSLNNKRINGFEALLRWRHPIRGFISPQEFIPIAEEMGAIVFIGLWVLKEACQQMHDWQKKFPETAAWKISVNISGKQLERNNFVGQVKAILQETGIAPNNLKLEITESCLIENSLSTLAILRELKAMGVELSLDDFGTGYSSLSYLHMFPFHTLKIDRSFVNSMEESSEKLGIIRAIVTLARNLGMDVISEGIETVSQLAQLKVLKCQYGQGFFFSRPLDSKATEALILTELTTIDSSIAEYSVTSLEEQIAKEQMLLHIEHLRQELDELKQEKNDLEIMLETATEHADLVELQLHQEICDRQKVESALHQVNQELGKLTILDSLTQVANRRRFDEYLLQQWQVLRKTNSPLSLVLCDVDHFKLYNDTYGHPIGDHCLQQVALAIEAAIEDESHLVCRYGGEEFAVILPNVVPKEAIEIANRVRSKVKSLKIAHHKSTVCEYVTMSVGVFTLTPTPEGSPEILISFADKALYEAKTQGRDRSIFALN
jgi:diguanylate cyclase (GGDEF)-like protein